MGGRQDDRNVVVLGTHPNQLSQPDAPNTLFDHKDIGGIVPQCAYCAWPIGGGFRLESTNQHLAD